MIAILITDLYSWLETIRRPSHLIGDRRIHTILMVLLFHTLLYVGINVPNLAYLPNSITIIFFCLSSQEIHLGIHFPLRHVHLWSSLHWCFFPYIPKTHLMRSQFIQYKCLTADFVSFAAPTHTSIRSFVRHIIRRLQLFFNACSCFVFTYTIHSG